MCRNEKKQVVQQLAAVLLKWTWIRWQEEAERAVPPGDKVYHNRAVSFDALSENYVSLHAVFDNTPRREILMKAMLQLSEKQRIVLQLYIFEEMDQHKIAARLKCKPQTVSKLYQRALVAMRQLLSTTVLNRRDCKRLFDIL